MAQKVRVVSGQSGKPNTIIVGAGIKVVTPTIVTTSGVKVSPVTAVRARPGTLTYSHDSNNHTKKMYAICYYHDIFFFSAILRVLD